MPQVVDYSSGRLTATQVRAAGYVGAVRYLRKRAPSSVSVLTAAEVVDYRTAGLGLGLVYEHTAPGWMLGGFAAGVSHATTALQDCRDVGIPDPRCVYLADDAQHDAAGVAAVMACLDGARTVLGDATGLYGFMPSVRAAQAQKRAYWFWQTGRVSDVDRGNPPNLYQHNNDNTTIAGITCDVSDVLREDWGQIDGGDDLDAEEHLWLSQTRTMMADVNHVTKNVLAPKLATQGAQIVALGEAIAHLSGGTVDMAAVLAAAEAGAEKAVREVFADAATPDTKAG